MKKLIRLNLVIVIILLITSCSTMSPTQVNNRLPNLTHSIYLTKTEADELVRLNKCKYLTRHRTFVTPMGLTAKGDLRNGAKGIDEWVAIDGGNAYTLISYKWVRVNSDGSTELHLEFDTLLCEQSE